MWGVGKADVLRREGAAIYVGDHVHDVEGALAAGAISVSVLTGGCTREELEAAGTHVVLDDLAAFPAWLDEHLLDLRLAALEADLRERGSVLVAYSGGADSALLLAAAVRALGPERVAAATGYSHSLPQSERDPARDFAESLGVEVLTPQTNEMEREGYRANGADRCYFCKAELIDVLGPIAAERGLAHVATGTNADDAVAGFRPGIRAADERGAVAPLRDAGLTKEQVRAASRRWGLPTWDKPAAACLSSRVAYGVEVTPYRLGRVERAEVAVRDALAEAGLVNLRVRDLGRPGLDRDRRRPAPARLRGRGRAPRRRTTGRVRGSRRGPPRIPVGIVERVAIGCAAAASAEQPQARRGQTRAHWQGEVVRRREGLRFPVPGGRTGRLRALRGAARGRPPASRPAPRSSSASPRAARGDQALQVRILDAPASVSRNQRDARRKKPDEMATIVEDLIGLLDGLGEGYRHGRQPDAQPDQAGRQAAPRARRRARAVAGQFPVRTSRDMRRGCRTKTKTAHATSTAVATPMPSRGGSIGIAMPMKPPITHASWRVVSLRAKALACTRCGTSRWIVASRENFASA